VPIFVQSLHMPSTITYPKINTWTHVDFELQQKWFKLISIFHAKTITQKYIHAFAKLVGLLPRKTKKLVLHFYDFSVILYELLSKMGIVVAPANSAHMRWLTFFTIFPCKLAIPLNMKVVCLDKLYNFYIGRNWSV
jgi:hypothetical protein